MPVYKRKREMKPYGPKRRRKVAIVSPGRMTRLSLKAGVLGFPNTLETTLRYSEIVYLTSTSGSVAQYAFRLNSLFDPNFTGTGHQPYYFDQLAAVYKRYTIRNAKMQAKFSHIVNATTTLQPSGPTIVGISGDDDGTVSTTLTTAMEDNNTKSDFLNNALGGNNVKTLSIDYSPQRDLGVEHTNDSLVALVSANPTRPWFGTVFMAETGLATPTTVAVRVEITFRVIFSEGDSIAGS